MNDYLQLLACPNCKQDLKKIQSGLFCSNCNKEYPILNEIVYFHDEKIENKSWENFYKEKVDYIKEKETYDKLYLKDTVTQLKKEAKFNKQSIFLEIGCGPFFLGQSISKDFYLIIGIDSNYNILEKTRNYLNKHNINNALLIWGDIMKIPIRDNSIDLIYGGGVIEHIRNTQIPINDCYRVLKKGGVCFNTVPMLNIGSLTYRQLWGNIPEFPLLKQIAEYIHIKILKERHMVFGYEKSFFPSTIRKLYKISGFENVIVKKFDVNIVFEFLPKLFRKPFCWLSKKVFLFWPMIKVVGKK